MPKKLLLVLLLILFGLFLLGGYLFAKYRQLKIVGPGGFLSSNFEVEFKDEVGLKGVEFNKKPFTSIAEKLGIWQNGFYDWQSSKDNPDETPKLIRPQKIVLVLTLEEQGFFRAKETKAENQLITISSFGQKIEENTLYLKIHFDKDFLNKLSPDALPDTFNYRTALALYKMSQMVEKTESPTLAVEQNAKLANDFVRDLLKANGQIFRKKGISFNKFRRALANLTLIKTAFAQSCTGIVICGTRVPTSASCSTSDPGGLCKTTNCGGQCGTDPYWGTCNCNYTCDFGDNVDLVCSFRTTESQCTGPSGRCPNPPYDCTDPAHQSQCSWSGGCSCSSWADGACGGGSCNSDERQQTRNCNPSGCSSESRCVADASCNGGPPPPSCTVNLTPDTATTSVGSGTTLTATVTIGSGTATQVDFFSGNTGIVTVSPASDSTVVYSTQATGVALGSTTVQADVIMSGASRCNDISTVNVNVAGPWWQVKDADVTTNGDLISPIPGSCSLPACNPVFGLKGDGGFPGVPAYGGATADFLSGAGSGSAAESPYNWLGGSRYLGRTYDYSYFERQIPDDVVFNELTPPVTGGTFNSGGAPSRGYVWYHWNGATLGDLTITGNVNLVGNRRVVLMAEGANVTINGRIQLQNPGQGFFMMVVGKDAGGLKGDILIDPSVDTIEGIFLAESEFKTGVTSSQFNARGSVAAYDGVVLERDLGASNSNTPAEVFTYAPDIIATFPQVFTQRRIRWKEVAP